MYKYPQKYDIIVVGAGHAGVEAALSSARMGRNVLLLTMNLDMIGQMSCNPAIGGVAKGQIVREIDALGGEMAKNTDRAAVQFRTLNLSKGPAVWSPRAQCDRVLYRQEMKNTLKKQPFLATRQEEVIKLLVSDDNKINGVLTGTGTAYYCSAVVITAGTFLNGLIHVGLKSSPAGRMGEFPSTGLSECLAGLGFELGRLKTGTPPRINSRTVDFSKLDIQNGNEPPEGFSHFTEKIPCAGKQLPCWITWTNTRTHKIINENLDRSPLYTGVIKSIGPRYCPSIEDKVVRFADRDRHQVFLEPEGYNTWEIYCNGISTSLPEDVQEAIVHSMKGCENAEILRYGYAVEYDFCPPTQLHPTLETKTIEGLYFAGQINGTTGYEEAAGQGLIAGINAVLKIQNKEAFVPGRDEAYIGVLIDDLVTKGVMDPYRMFTSRAEFRLVLRSDNADIRLMDYGYKFGLIPKEHYQGFCKYREDVRKNIDFLEETYSPQEHVPLAHLIRRGESYDSVMSGLSDKPPAGEPVAPEANGPIFVGRDKPHAPSPFKRVKQQVEIEIKYAGYIRRQKEEIEKFKKLENKKIPGWVDYENIRGLLKESRIKLKQIMPGSIGQAARISGVTPSDIAILLVHLKKCNHDNPNFKF